jgi:hypothetical protein
LTGGLLARPLPLNAPAASAVPTRNARRENCVIMINANPLCCFSTGSGISSVQGNLATKATWRQNMRKIH